VYSTLSVVGVQQTVGFGEHEQGEHPQEQDMACYRWLVVKIKDLSRGVSRRSSWWR
jgi:hypothetical protein